MLVSSQLLITASEINQSSLGGSGYWSSLIGLSLQLVVVLYGFSGRSLRLILVVSRLVAEKKTPTSKVRSGSYSRQAGMCYVREV